MSGEQLTGIRETAGPADLTATAQHSQKLEEILRELPEGAQRLYADHHGKILTAPGSRRKHQAWPGGYADHVIAVCEIAAELYQLWSGPGSSAARPIEFALKDAWLVLFLHDLEKPFKYCPPESVSDRELQSRAASDPEALRSELISRYGIPLSGEQRNALRYVHGEPDSEYSPDERLAGRLAAFCHCCDYLSARMWYDQPHPELTQ